MSDDWTDVLDDVVDLHRAGHLDVSKVLAWLPTWDTISGINIAPGDWAISAMVKWLGFAVFGVFTLLFAAFALNVTGVFPWLGYSTARSTHIGSIDTGVLQTGLGTSRVFAFSGQYILVDYEYRAGSGRSRSFFGPSGHSPILIVQPKEYGMGMSQIYAKRFFFDGGTQSGKFAFPIRSTTLYTIRLDHGKMNDYDLGSYISVTWGISSGRPDASYTIVPDGQSVSMRDYR